MNSVRSKFEISMVFVAKTQSLYKRSFLWTAKAFNFKIVKNESNGSWNQKERKKSFDFRTNSCDVNLQW